MPELNIRDLNKNGGLRRFGEARVISQEDRTVELAFSSEEPVERWFGEEILSHDDGSIRMGRMQSGAALLVNHDWDDQVGVVDRVEIGSDRRGRAVVRFGRGARAEEIFRDVVDGIRKHVSVGYLVHRVEVVTRKGAPDLVRVIDWEPYEISIVAVPADPTVGIGRGMPVDVVNTRAMEGQMPEDTNTQTPAPLAAAPAAPVQAVNTDAIRAAATDAERARVRSITETAARFEAPADFVRQHLDAGSSVEAFNAALLDRMNQNRGAALTEGGNQIGMTDREVRQYSMMRLFRALANPTDVALQRAAAFEFECAQAAAERAHRSPKGVLIPADVLTRTISTGTTGGETGGYLVATELMSQSFVEMLRNRSVAMQLGTPMGGLVGNVDIPTQASGATGYWLGEDAETTVSQMEFGQFSLSPKTVAGMTEITRRMLMQSSLDVEALARRDLATTLALAIDLAAFYGTGASNQPRGIANTAGINAVDFGTDGAGAGTGQLPTYAEIVQMETEIAADNADVGSMAYVANARMRGHFKTTPKFATGTADQGLIWEPGNTVNGYRTEITNQISNGDVFFGNFADLLMGMWGGLDVNVDPFTHSARGRIRIVMMQDVDMAVRRAQSFCLGRDSTA